MSRYSNPVPDVPDSNGDPIIGAKLYFYETGTTTLKTVYSDSNFSTAIANPVISVSGGRLPSIFLNGVYKVVQKDENDVEIWSRDPVGDVDAGQFDTWINDKSYSFNDIVKGSDLAFYKSLTAGIETNQGSDPISNPAEWGLSDFAFIGENVSFSSVSGAVVSKTKIDTTSGSEAAFTSIPAWVKKITIAFNGVSVTTVGVDIQIQIGDSGGLETTGYDSLSNEITNAISVSFDGSTTGFIVAKSWGGNIFISGSLTIALLDASDNTWVYSGNLYSKSRGQVLCGGNKSLSGTLDRLSVVTDGTFDAGKVNILYEG